MLGGVAEVLQRDREERLDGALVLASLLPWYRPALQCRARDPVVRGLGLEDELDHGWVHGVLEVEQVD